MNRGEHSRGLQSCMMMLHQSLHEGLETGFRFSEVLIGQCLGGQPNSGTIEEFAERRTQDVAATQIAHGGEGERGAEVLRGSRGLT